MHRWLGHSRRSRFTGFTMSWKNSPATFASVRQRVATTSSTLATSRLEASRTLTALVNQQDLANSVGSVREAAARVLTDLRSEHLVRTSPGRVEILDPLRMSHELWSRARDEVTAPEKRASAQSVSRPPVNGPQIEGHMFAVDHAATALLIKQRFPSVSLTPMLCRSRRWNGLGRSQLSRRRAHDDRGDRPQRRRHSSRLHAVFPFGGDRGGARCWHGWSSKRVSAAPPGPCRRSRHRVASHPGLATHGQTSCFGPAGDPQARPLAYTRRLRWSRSSSN